MINKNTHTPVYIQIKEYYQRKIALGEFLPGDKIPTEQEIANKWGVSKMTVRQGLQKLVSEKIVYAKRGVGLFVQNEHLELDTFKFTSFSSRKKGSIKTDVLDFKKINLTEEEAMLFFENDHTDVWYSERLRYLSGTPAMYEISYMPCHLFPDMTRDCISSSKYNYVLEQKKYSIEKAKRTFMAHIANEKIANILNLKTGTAVIKVESHGILSNQNIFEYVILFYHPELCVIKETSSFSI